MSANFIVFVVRCDHKIFIVATTSFGNHLVKSENLLTAIFALKFSQKNKTVSKGSVETLFR